MYSFSSFFSFFRGFAQAKADVAEAKEESSSPNTYSTKRNHGGPGTNNKFGRETREEQIATDTRNGARDKAPDVYVTPERTPTYTNTYVNHLGSTSINEKYANSRAKKRAYKGYSTGGIFSYGVSRLSSLTGLFDSMISNPLQQRSSYWT